MFCLLGGKKYCIVPYDTSPLAYFSLGCSKERQRANVEAKNSVPQMWVPGADGASGATGYEGSLLDPPLAGFVVVPGEREASTGEGGMRRG